MIIEARHVGKKFKRRVAGTSSYNTLRDTLGNGLRRLNPFARPSLQNNDLNKHSQEDFWALKDVNFQIDRGEVVGIIGRNGAGKSTLLKVLSQITSPTEGEILMNGRVGYLLEVGTGFHPELTGRENVFMNGAILGMSRREIMTKFDEIVEFSGVGEFIDMPVKRYSSGMHMRLAFAVAAHLDPEIMIVDEVLAVGDADFQKKCLGKMKDVSNSGRTVLFVSHNMNAIQQLCSRVIWMDNGKVRADSNDIHKTASEYLFGNHDGDIHIKGEWNVENDAKLETEYFSLISFKICDENNHIVERPIQNSEQVYCQIEIDVKKLNPALNFGYAILNEEGNHVYWTATTDQAEEKWPEIVLGKNIFKSHIPRQFLNEGLYRLDLFASLHAKGWFSEPANTPYSIFLSISGGLSQSPYWRAKRPGILAPVIEWSSKK